MKITKVSVIDAYELERAVEEQFGLETGTISLIDLSDEACENDSYQVIYFAESDIEEMQEMMDYAEQHNYPNSDSYRYRLLILTYLHDILPDEDKVFWLCAW